MRVKWFSAGLVSGCCIAALLIVMYQMSYAAAPEERQLLVPTQDYIKEHGYPVNASGETYGPNVSFIYEEPDLLLAENEEGTRGYIRQSEDPSAWVTTPEDAVIYRSICEKGHNNHTWLMYLEDGKTIVGKFTDSCPFCNPH